MRIWHQNLIPHLPRQQLLGQHRECCALRGRGWGRNHSVVNYVFDHDPNYLIAYHYLIMNEMKNRGYNPDSTWFNVNWRGTHLGEQTDWANDDKVCNIYFAARDDGMMVFPEHDEVYLQECIDNLKTKGIEINELL